MELELPYKNKEDLYRNQVKRWINLKLKAIEYLGGKCSNCGYNKYYGALHFHHLNPNEKDVNWTKLRLRSWTKITEELDKCICLCANCHAEEHSTLHSS